MGCLVEALSRGYDVLGLAAATGGDEVFFQLVLARIIEPVSKLDSLQVLEEAGLAPAPYRTVTRRLWVFARDSWRQQISAACAAHARLGPASLVLYDCSTLLCRASCYADAGHAAAGHGGLLALDVGIFIGGSAAGRVGSVKLTV